VGEKRTPICTCCRDGAACEQHAQREIPNANEVLVLVERSDARVLVRALLAYVGLDSLATSDDRAAATRMRLKLEEGLSRG
jgi:hypothetical protein